MAVNGAMGVQLAAAVTDQAPTSSSMTPQSRLDLVKKFAGAALKFLGKSRNWLKDTVQKGYQAFLDRVWNKIPSWIRAIVGWGMTAYKVYQILRDLFFS